MDRPEAKPLVAAVGDEELLALAAGAKPSAADMRAKVAPPHDIDKLAVLAEALCASGTRCDAAIVEAFRRGGARDARGARGDSRRAARPRRPGFSRAGARAGAAGRRADEMSAA